MTLPTYCGNQRSLNLGPGAETIYLLENWAEHCICTVPNQATDIIKLRTAAVNPGLNAVPLSFKMLLLCHQKCCNIVTVYLAGNAHLVKLKAQGIYAIKGNIQKFLGVHVVVSMIGMSKGI